MKICTVCKKIKSLSDFNRSKNAKDGRTAACSKCYKERSKKYSQSKSGLLSRIYFKQKRNSKRRGHVSPSYTLEEFKLWAMSDNVFHKLYANWSESNHKKMLVPSADRTDDYKGYDLSRLKWMTWGKNKEKGDKDRSEGKSPGKNKPVFQLTMDGDVVNHFHSGCKASKHTGINQQHLNACCRGKRKSAGGFAWSFA